MKYTNRILFPQFLTFSWGWKKEIMQTDGYELHFHYQWLKQLMVQEIPSAKSIPSTFKTSTDQPIDFGNQTMQFLSTLFVHISYATLVTCGQNI